MEDKNRPITIAIAKKQWPRFLSGKLVRVLSVAVSAVLGGLCGWWLWAINLGNPRAYLRRYLTDPVRSRGDNTV